MANSRHEVINKRPIRRNGVTRRSDTPATVKSEGGADNNAHLSRITVFNRRRADDSTNRIGAPDDYETVDGQIMGTNEILPPFDIESLCSIFDRSNILRQCIDAIVVNTTSHGYRIVQVDPEVAIDPEEKALLKSFIDYANPDESLDTVTGSVSEDKNRIGFGFLEVMRDQNGVFSHVRYIRSRYIRLCRRTKIVQINRRLRRGSRTITVQTNKSFRRYVQRINSSVVYFKEFGDPRLMSRTTGMFDGENGKRVRRSDAATELLHFRVKSDDIYGVPKWVSQLPSILGSRESEECNYQYFQDNMIPAGILMVSGGKLTKQSYVDLRKTLTGEGLGKDRQNKILLLEAVPERDGIDDSGTVSIKLEPLSTARPSDGLFASYDKGNQDKIRGTYRLPPTAIGASQDTTFATANVSQAVAEAQVYLPERNYSDGMLNKNLINGEFGFNLQTCKLESLSPAITSPEQIVKAMTALGVLGGITPRAAVTLANQELRVPIKQYPLKDEEGYEEWMDMPTHVLMKLMAGANTTDDEANGKDASTKSLEDDGDLEKQPEHGSE